MVMNNTICRLAELLGLKDSEQATVAGKRESVFEQVRQNEELREGIKGEMTDIDNQLRMRKEEYLNASPGNQLVVKSQIMSLKKDRDYLVRKLEAVAGRIDAGRLLLHKYESLLFAIRNPAAIDEMEEVRDELDAWTRDLEHEGRVSQRLFAAGTVSHVVEADVGTIDEDGYFGRVTQREDPEFLALLEEIR